MFKLKLRPVRVSKVEALPGRPVGTSNSQPITEGYWIVGEELTEPKIGSLYTVLRQVRNGVESTGLFRTSEVKKLEDIDHSSTLITTNNSVYKIEYIFE